MFEWATQLRTTDIDQGRAALETFSDGMKLIPRGAAGRFDMRLNTLSLPMWTALYARFGTPMLNTGRMPDYYCIAVALTGGMRLQWADGQRMKGTARSGAITSAGAFYEADSSLDYAGVAVVVPELVLRQTLEAMLNRPVDDRIVFRQCMDQHTVGGRWFELIELVGREAGRPDGLVSHPLAMEHLQQVVIESLLSLQPHNFSAALAGGDQRVGAHVVSRAVELMHEQLQTPWTTATLARACGVSARSLQEAFVRENHAPPMTFLRQLRLARVHAELLAADPAVTTVTAVRERWLFFNGGRFAHYYRRRFGHSPSQTLAAAKL